MVVGPSAAWLTENGFLSPLKVFAPPIGFSDTEVKKVGKDFDMRSASGNLKAREIMGDVISHYKKYLDGKTAIAFCCTVKHAEQVAASFNSAKINAASIDGKMSAEQRTKLLFDLESGELKVLTSCQLIGEGIDIPNVAGCILLRPTASIALHLQMIGRALRPQKGKTAIILDHVGNISRLGHPMYFTEEDWSLEGKEIDKTNGDNAIKTCPDCNSVIPRTSRECPECGHDFTIDPIELRIVNGELVEISPYEELRSIIEPMVKQCMGDKAISARLFQLGHTSPTGEAFSTRTISIILKSLDLKKPFRQLLNERDQRLHSIIEPMVSNDMTLKEISNELFKLGLVNSDGSKIKSDALSSIIKRLNIVRLPRGSGAGPNNLRKEEADKRAEYIRDIIEPMISTGLSQRKMCTELFKKGVKSSSGGEISRGTLYDIIQRLQLNQPK
jgi:hypothetical protein